MINNVAQYLFLPLTESVLPNPRNPEYGNPAFGLVTSSSFYGKRQWQVFDAFTDGLFHQKLCNLFLPWEGVPENHINAYINVQESGVGTFKFQTKHEIRELIYLKGEKTEFTGSDLWFRFAEYNLKIYQLLPTTVDHKFLKESPDIAGWIEYSGEKGLQILIGVLYNATNEFL